MRPVGSMRPLECLSALRPAGLRDGRRRGQRGLITLEWLLITGAVGAFAALAVLVVERTLDAEVELPPDPVARLIDADIDAAFVAGEAVRTAIRGAATSDPGDDYSQALDEFFKEQCEAIEDTYDDVVDVAVWEWDWAWTAAATPGGPLPPDLYPEGPARCRVTPLDLSGTGP